MTKSSNSTFDIKSSDLYVINKNCISEQDKEYSNILHNLFTKYVAEYYNKYGKFPDNFPIERRCSNFKSWINEIWLHWQIKKFNHRKDWTYFKISVKENIEKIFGTR